MSLSVGFRSVFMIPSIPLAVLISSAIVPSIRLVYHIFERFEPCKQEKWKAIRENIIDQFSITLCLLQSKTSTLILWGSIITLCVSNLCKSIGLFWKIVLNLYRLHQLDHPLQYIQDIPCSVVMIWSLVTPSVSASEAAFAFWWIVQLTLALDRSAAVASACIAGHLFCATSLLLLQLRSWHVRASLAVSCP